MACLGNDKTGKKKSRRRFGRKKREEQESSEPSHKKARNESRVGEGRGKRGAQIKKKSREIAIGISTS